MATEKTVEFKQINHYKQRSGFMHDLWAYFQRLSLTLWGIIKEKQIKKRSFVFSSPIRQVSKNKSPFQILFGMCLSSKYVAVQPDTLNSHN